MTGHWIETFLEAMQAEQDASDNTIMAYARDLHEFEAHLKSAKKDFKSACRADVEAYIVDLKNRGLAAATRARRLSSLRQLFRFAFEETWREDDGVVKGGESICRKPREFAKEEPKISGGGLGQAWTRIEID